jgi:hypothetical protein
MQYQMQKIYIGKKRKVLVPKLFRFIFPHKEKRIAFFYKYYERNSFLYLLFQNNFTLIVINWISQGVPAMSKSERIFHFLFELIFFILFILCSELAVLPSLVYAHTINWVFNSHFWTFIRFLNIQFNTSDNYYIYLRNLKVRLENSSSFLIVVVIGGIALDKSFSDSSDIDVKFIVKQGYRNHINGNLFLICEKFRAFFYRIPLDANLYSDLLYFQKINQNESPYVLFQAKEITDDALIKYKLRDYIIR